MFDQAIFVFIKINPICIIVELVTTNIDRCKCAPGYLVTGVVIFKDSNNKERDLSFRVVHRFNIVPP
jgi:hypothetical protein